MNRIQQISLELQTRNRREELGLDDTSDHSPDEVRTLWQASHLERLKNRLRRQFAGHTARPEAG